MSIQQQLNFCGKYSATSDPVGHKYRQCWDDNEVRTVGLLGSGTMGQWNSGTVSTVYLWLLAVTWPWTCAVQVEWFQQIRRLWHRRSPPLRADRSLQSHMTLSIRRSTVTWHGPSEGQLSHDMVHQEVSCHMPCHAMPCHAMPCHAMPCHAMPCHAMPCHAMPCHAMTWQVGSQFEDGSQLHCTLLALQCGYIDNHCMKIY